MKKSLFLVGLVFFLNVPGVFAQPTIDCTKSSLGLDFTGAAEDGSPLLIETISVHFEIGEGMTGTPASPHFTRKEHGYRSALVTFVRSLKVFMEH